MTTKKFIKGAIKKPGALSKQLGIPIKKNIPYALLRKIVIASPGSQIKNPSKLGKRIITVTGKMKQRARLAITLKKLKRRK